MLVVALQCGKYFSFGEVFFQMSHKGHFTKMRSLPNSMFRPFSHTSVFHSKVMYTVTGGYGYFGTIRFSSGTSLKCCIVGCYAPVIFCYKSLP